MKPLTSQLLNQIPNVKHVFGTREYPSDWNPRPKWKQVHGVAIGIAKSAESDLGEIDALVTGTPHLPIGIVTADCVPILLARLDGKRVASVHAGWRGTLAHIAESLKKTLESLGEKDLSAWVAAIGPSIRACCYEVSPELAYNFTQAFGADSALDRGNGKRHLDLQEINRRELIRLGVSAVDVIAVCTKCTLNPDGTYAFESHRRDHAKGRQFSVIEITD